MAARPTSDQPTLTQRALRNASTISCEDEEVEFESLQPKMDFWPAIVDSFRRNPKSYNAEATAAALWVPNRRIGYDVHAANAAAAASPLTRGLKARHLQMIGICGTIGYGLFVTSGTSLAYAGPAWLCLAFGLGGIVLLCTMNALGEMAILYPVAGSFAQYSIRFIDPSWGFAMGWNYAFHWLILLPAEIVIACILIEYWNVNTGLDAVWVTLFLGLTCTLNMFKVKVYGESEFYFSIIKVTTIIAYAVLGIIINIGGGSGGSYIGFKYWRNPGAFNHGFKGLAVCINTAVSAYGGTELIGLTAAEAFDPRRILPRAIKQVFWRIFLFYFVSIFIVSTLVPYNEPLLIQGTTSGARTSPFVLSIVNAGIQVFPSVMNAAIVIAVVSLANTSTYAASRMLAALAEQRLAPSIFAYIDRAGRPLIAIITVSLFGGLAYLAVSNKRTTAFNWMSSFTALSSVFTWLSINVAHLRFRQAWKDQGHDLDELPYRSPFGLYGSVCGIIGTLLFLIAKIWVSMFPPDYGAMDVSQRAIAFFQGCLNLPVLFILYFGHKLWQRTKFVKISDVDLFTGNRGVGMDFKELLAAERAAKKAWPRWKKIYRFLC